MTGVIVVGGAFAVYMTPIVVVLWRSEHPRRFHP